MLRIFIKKLIDTNIYIYVCVFNKLILVIIRFNNNINIHNDIHFSSIIIHIIFFVIIITLQNLTISLAYRTKLCAKYFVKLDKIIVHCKIC